MNHIFFLLCLLPFCLYSNAPTSVVQTDSEYRPYKSPEQIQQELDQAEADFEYAKTLFYPWYTGPLITPAAGMVSPGTFIEQPYIYGVDNYAAFNEDRKSVSLSSHLVQLQSQPILFLTGITDSVDTTVVFGGTMNWQDGKFGGGIFDLSATLGFLVAAQDLYVPQVKFSISQSFPTGKYKNLSTNGLGLNATGAGAYKTQFGLVASKVLFWATRYPVNARVFFGYRLSTPVRVRNFNAYGGGFGTRGVVHPGNTLFVDGGIEFSLTQRWVLAADLVYSAQNRTTFHGKLGTLADGTPATVGGGFNDNLSIAPAFEYNFSAQAGIIAGLWFSVYGRNSLNFVQGLVSYYIQYP